MNISMVEVSMSGLYSRVVMEVYIRHGVVIHTNRVIIGGIALEGIILLLFKAKPTAIIMKIAEILDNIVAMGSL